MSNVFALCCGLEDERRCRLYCPARTRIDLHAATLHAAIGGTWLRNPMHVAGHFSAESVLPSCWKSNWIVEITVSVSVVFGEAYRESRALRPVLKCARHFRASSFAGTRSRPL